MKGPTHHLVGLYAGAVIGLAAGWPLWQVAESAVVATSTAYGQYTSPDADQGWLAFLGRHRGTTHWPGWPIIVMGLGMAGPPTAWPTISLAFGYLSHIVPGDLVFGGPGIPLLPFPPYWHVGLCLPTDGHRKGKRVGLAERVTRRVLLWGLLPSIAAGLCFVATAGPGAIPAAA